MKVLQFNLLYYCGGGGFNTYRKWQILHVNTLCANHPVFSTEVYDSGHTFSHTMLMDELCVCLCVRVCYNLHTVRLLTSVPLVTGTSCLSDATVLFVCYLVDANSIGHVWMLTFSWCDSLICLLCHDVLNHAAVHFNDQSHFHTKGEREVVLVVQHADFLDTSPWKHD